MSTDGDAAVTLDMWNGIYGEVSTYNYSTGTALPLVLNSNGGNVGIGTTTPAARLDVLTRSTNAVAVSGSNTVSGVYGQLAVSYYQNAYLGVYGNDGNTSPSFNFGDYAGYFDGKVNVNGPSFLNGTVNVNGSLGVNGSVYLNSPLQFPGAGADTSTPVFTHKATVANVTNNKTYINNPICNGQPNAILLITQNWSASDNIGNPKETGVYYEASVGQWTIFVVDGTAMPIGVAYNVMVTLP
jgi:hypothetical protein